MTVIDAVLLSEGWPRYTNDPADHGGPTKGGITLARLSAYRGHPCTAADVEALEEPEARALYQKMYVTDWRFDMLDDPWVQWFVVDTGVLQGQETSARMLQSVLGVPVDGVIGPITLAALRCTTPAFRLQMVKARLHLLLDAMVSDVPHAMCETTNLKWRHGWVNRVLQFLR
jgi:lysozyme family protein